jgi:hypothetical protein
MRFHSITSDFASQGKKNTKTKTKTKKKKPHTTSNQTGHALTPIGAQPRRHASIPTPHGPNQQ